VITKTRFVEKKSNHMFIRFDEGENNIDKFLNDIDFSLYDFVIVSDYDKGFLSNDDLINISKSSKLSILDSKRKLSPEIIKNFTFIKLNEKELQNNIEFQSFDNIITTLGSVGSMYGGKIYESPNPQETIDVSGAGDTFTSSFILKYHETKDIEQSIIFANKMSSIVVSKRGVSTP
jgi:bifunctional ADP-heptose synthase (sugar kinase/adenylyltransferase)